MLIPRFLSEHSTHILSGKLSRWPFNPVVLVAMCFLQTLEISLFWNSHCHNWFHRSCTNYRLTRGVIVKCNGIVQAVKSLLVSQALRLTWAWLLDMARFSAWMPCDITELGCGTPINSPWEQKQFRDSFLLYGIVMATNFCFCMCGLPDGWDRVIRKNNRTFVCGFRDLIRLFTNCPTLGTCSILLDL